MLMRNLPPHVANMREMAELLAAQQPELTALQASASAMRAEFCWRTITERTIDIWEDALGFDHAPAWDMQRRRERVYNRLIVNSPLTPERMCAMLEQVGGVPCEIDEDAPSCTAIVRFTGYFGVPVYIDDIKAEVERIRPFHVVFGYNYRYPLVREYYGYTAAQLGGYTVAQLAAGAPLND